VHDSGAYDPYGLTILNTQSHVLGAYDIPNYQSELKVVFTNKTSPRWSGQDGGSYHRKIDGYRRQGWGSTR
jgi:hypothetical protein